MSKRVFGALGALSYEQLELLSTGELLALHNAARPDKPVKVFHTKAKAMQRVWELYPNEDVPQAPDEPVVSAQEDNATEATEMAKEAKKMKKVKTEGKRGPRLDRSLKLKVLVKENPKRAGTASAKRFEKYFSCKTVDDAMTAGITSSDIAWDKKHGYIQVG